MKEARGSYKLGKTLERTLPGEIYEDKSQGSTGFGGCPNGSIPSLQGSLNFIKEEILSCWVKTTSPTCSGREGNYMTSESWLWSQPPWEDSV